MPFLPILVFGGLFLAFSGQTLFGSNQQNAENTDCDDAQTDRAIAVDLTEAELTDAIAIYIKPKTKK